MKWLNYHHLLYFKTIATEGGIARAAKKLQVGQPALSSQLKKLEESFGHNLFERKNRSLILTEAGKVVLQYANEIDSKGQELLEVIDSQTFSSRTRVNLGALDSVPKTLVTRLVRAARKFQHCRVTVLEGRGDELLRELSTHQLDLVLSNYPAQAMGGGPSLYSRSLAKVPVAIFGAPKFKDLKRKFPNSLAGQPMILPTTHSKLRQDVDHYFTLNKMVHNTVAEIEDTSVQKLLAVEGMGLIPIPAFSVKAHVKEKKLVQIGVLDGVWEEFWLMSAERTIENPVVMHLIKNFSFE